MKKYSILIIFFTLIAVNACKKDSLDTYGSGDAGKSSTYPVSGEWWVKYSLGTSYESDYYKLLTYNLATNKGDSIWVDDNGDFWNESIKFKSVVDVKNKTFSVKNAVNINDGSANPTKVTLLDGKVLLGVATTTSGNKSDSIYVKFIYSDDPADTFVCAGYRRTGFQADDH